MTGKPLRIETGDMTVSAVWDLPKESRAGFVLAHGAGARYDHAGMAALAAALAHHGFAVLRFNFRYTEKGRRSPDRAPVAVQTWFDVWNWVRRRPEVDGLPLLAGGRSFGGRMATLAAAEPGGGRGAEPGAEPFNPHGLILFAYPLHPPGKPDKLRTEHLGSISAPLLFLSGTRDSFATVSLMDAAVAGLGPSATLHWLEGADHGFKVLKRSGRTDDEVREESAEVAGSWCRRLQS